ncbi:hypothetical protein COU17_03325 [Candidatus Kaiserbacteria bacterium CG10_big_fil_rev_8_21_14_0_10_49_17]|uniref:NAD-dependent epimerase/dehydratase domain-containing protein n=1 Tax=Candidatus Kaiserbacteria bacterium CG10_big_fil_rev_8_21_14_0_10_49_17 TaxID=1974609 RepID=A0A2M6WDT0_9BACT|nr:MAG: hypothetical protein COU17_03325 [Candidatus Kaiserbacteria bacterium CG10_big_fil_rev_8_21_14_0_10_49_17]
MTESQKKVILVTGGAGFIGSHLCERLAQDSNNRVISLDNYFTGSKENHVAGVEYREGHTRDIGAIVPERPDVIFHLGEYARVEQSILEPDIVEDLNTAGTAAVIDYWRTHKCKLVYAGSSTKFGDGGATRHTSPYARTKAANTERVREVGEQEKLSYAITYFYNVYGPRERTGVYGTVIEHFKRMYLSGTPCAVVAPGTQERNFTHVADIVEALVRVGEDGEKGEYGLGCEEAHTILEVARLFGCDDENTVIFPERAGNRMTSSLDTSKTRALGWRAHRSLTDYITAFTAEHARGAPREKRVLVFSTTMHPVSGRAEDAFIELAQQLPGVHFDVVTARFTRNINVGTDIPENVHIHRLGIGSPLDKFLLPVLGAFTGGMLATRHRYLFLWSLLASYAALAAVSVRYLRNLSLLVTLADQSVDELSASKRAALSLLISGTDQVYGTHTAQEQQVGSATRRALPRNSMGAGDAFANAMRFAYADIVRKQQP